MITGAGVVFLADRDGVLLGVETFEDFAPGARRGVAGLLLIASKESTFFG